MNRSEQIAAEHECARLIYLYAQTLDAYDYDGFVRLWADDGVWVTLKGPQSGHAEIRSYLDARPPGQVARHVVSNVVVDVLDANRARGRSYYAFFPGTPSKSGRLAILGGAALMGEYNDEFRLTADGWRFARREIIMTMAAPVKKDG